MTFKELYGDKSSEIYNGDFDCSNKGLTSLEGCYKEIKGEFFCSNNNITSFEHCPDITGSFYCSGNKLTSFKYCPDIKGVFYCIGNEITSFEHEYFYRNVILDKNNMKKYLEYGKIDFPEEFLI
jgi:hypothetical protein